MQASPPRLIGSLVWRVGKWYVRQRLPSMRKVVLTVGGLLTLTAAVALAARRLSE